MNQSTAIQLREYSKEELQTIQQTIAKGTTPQQFQLFIKTAQYAGLNPFLNHIYCIVYGQGQNAQMSIQISVEGIVYLAKQHPEYQGYDVQLVHENDEFRARKISADGEDRWEIAEHEIGFPRGKVIGGYAVAYRKGHRPFVVLMDVEEVQHNMTGTNSSTWKKYFNDMFKKHILKRAIKGQFGIDIAEDDTPGQSVRNIPEYRPEPKEITSEVDQAGPQPEPVTEDNEEKEKQLKDEIKAKFKQLGITNAEERAEFFEEHGIAFENPKKPTMSEMTGLIRVLNMVIAQQSDADELPE